MLKECEICLKRPGKCHLVSCSLMSWMRLVSELILALEWKGLQTPGGMEESDQVINQFLVELDGLSTRSGEVFVIGATNRDQKIDKALMRSGRLERKIYIDLPTLSERGEIFKLNLLKIKSNWVIVLFNKVSFKAHWSSAAKSFIVIQRMSDYRRTNYRPRFLDPRNKKIYIDLPTLSERGEIFKLNLLKIKSNFNLDNQATRLALLTPSYSGADVANIVNEAAIQAAGNGQTVVEAHNFEHAIERVIAGLERRSHSVTKDETKISAYYEASQALVGWVLPKGDKVI